MPRKKHSDTKAIQSPRSTVEQELLRPIRVRKTTATEAAAAVAVVAAAAGGGVGGGTTPSTDAFDGFLSSIGNLLLLSAASKKHPAVIEPPTASTLEQPPAPPSVDWAARCKKLIDDHFDESFPPGHTETIHYGKAHVVLASPDDGVALWAFKETPGFMMMDFSCGPLITFLKRIALAGLSEPKRHEAGIVFQFRLITIGK